MSNECEICKGESLERVAGFYEMCDEHRNAYNNLIAEKVLRNVIPGALHHAHPRDLPKALEQWDGTNGSGLYLYGGVGAGKSHAAAALLKRAYMQRFKQGLYPSVQWMNVPMAMLELLKSFGSANKRQSEEWDQAQIADLLVIDDIGMEQPKEWMRIRIYALLEYRMHSRLTTIVTSNLDLAELGDRIQSQQIASRLSQMCDQVSFNTKDRRPALSPSQKK